MTKITNISGNPILYRDDEAEVVEIAAGVEVDVNISKDHPKVLADEAAGLTEVGGTKKTPKAVREKTPAAPAHTE